MAWHKAHHGEFGKRESATERAKEIRKAGYKARVVKIPGRPTKGKGIRYMVDYWS